MKLDSFLAKKMTVVEFFLCFFPFQDVQILQICSHHFICKSKYFKEEWTFEQGVTKRTLKREKKNI